MALPRFSGAGPHQIENKRRRWLVLGWLLLALAPSAHIAWKSRDMPHLGQYHDDGIYWVTAKSLAEGHGYRILSLPDQPYQTKYPPMYPLLLSAIWRLKPSFPGNLSVAIWQAWLMLPAFLLLARVTFQDLGLEDSHGWVLCAVLAVSPVVVLLSISLMSDLLFCCFLLGSLCLTDRAGGEDSGHGIAVVAALLAGAAYLTRIAALPLLVTGPLWLVLRKQYTRAALYAFTMALAVVGWNLWMRAHLSASTDIVSLYYTNYVGYQLHNVPWSDAPLVASKNLYFLFLAMSQSFVYDAGDSFWWDFYWRLFVLASIAGVVRLARKRLTAYHLFAAGFVPLLLVCCWPPDGRAVLSLFPLLLAGLWRELGHIVHMLRKSLHRPNFAARAFAGLIAAALVVSAGLALRTISRALFRVVPGVVAQHRELLAATQGGYQWISQNLPQEATFLAYDDTILYLHTGYRACGMRTPTQPYYHDNEEAAVEPFYSVADFARSHNLGYVLTTAGDFYRGEITVAQRSAFRRSVEGSKAFRLLYDSDLVRVRGVMEHP